MAADGMLDGKPEAQIQTSLARIELSMDTFAMEQRQILKVIQELRSDFLEQRRKSSDALLHSGTSLMLSAECPTPKLKSESSFPSRSTQVAQVGPSEDKTKADMKHLVKHASANLKCSLSQHWPVSLTRRPAVESLCGQHANLSLAENGLMTASSSIKGPQQIPGMDSKDEYAHFCIIMPASVSRFILDILATLSLAWDLIFVPLQLAWDLNVEGSYILVSISVAFFWTLDVILNFRTAFYTVAGDLETNPCRIAVHYVRHQFFLDLFIVVCDWIHIVAGISGLNMMRALKMTRLVRLSRVLRLLSGDVVEKLKVLGMRLELVESFKIMSICIWLTHVISCAWFSIGNLESSDTGLHWVDSSWATTAPSFADAKFGFQYASALQWTLTTMVSGTSSVFPLNSVEQIFSCFCIMLGLLGQAFVISILSSTAVEENLRRRYLTTTLSSMNKFCSTHRVGVQLQQNARRQVIASIMRKANAGLSTQEVEGLQLASRKVRMNILKEVFEPNLRYHDLLFLCTLVDAHTFSKLTSSALQLRYVQIGHDIFMAGNSASQMFLLSKGTATYMQEPETSKESRKKSAEVFLHTWLCEPALWTNWIHVGTMEATSGECELHCLEVLEFIRIASTSAMVNSIVYDYAVQYHLRVIESVPPIAPWPNDIVTNGASFAHILVSMSDSTRKLIASLTLECAMNLELLPVRDDYMEVMGREIQEGKMNLVISGTASSPYVHRVVSFARIHLTTSDDRTFVELGRKNPDGSSVVTCEIPHEKQRGSEDILTTVQRIVDRLSLAAGSVTLEFTKVAEDFHHFTRSTLSRRSKLEFPIYRLFFDAHYRCTTDPDRSKLKRVPTAGKFARQVTAGLNSMLGRQESSSIIAPSTSPGTGKIFKLSSTSNDSLREQLENSLLIEKNIFALRSNDDNRATVVYAWLSGPEIEFLQSRKGVEFLEGLFQIEDWIDSVQDVDSVQDIDVSNTRVDTELSFAFTPLDEVPHGSGALSLEGSHVDGSDTPALEPVIEI